MKIGLVRHSKVIDTTTKRWMTSADFDRWVKHYDTSEVYGTDTIPNGDWDCCYSSDQQRAVTTAGILYQGEINQTELLREISICSVASSNWRLHHIIWLALARLGWLVNHSSQEAKASTLMRAKKIIDQIELQSGDSTLVVSHGAFMGVLRKELRRRGYRGAYFFVPVNGKIYLFTKET